MKNKEIILPIMLWLLSSSSWAADVTYSGATLTGATGIVLDGTVYDVAFGDFSCVDLYSPCTSDSHLPFSTPTGRGAAHNALRQVLMDEFISQPFLYSNINGCLPSSQNFCYLWTVPIATSGNAIVTWRTIEISNTMDSGFGGWHRDSAFPVEYYASTKWSVSSVPIPAAVWLFGSGLVGLIGIARRKKA